MSLKRRRQANGRNDCVKVYEPEPLQIAKFVVSTFGASKVRFRVPTPDARLQVKIAIIWPPVTSFANQAIPYDVTDGGLIQYFLWLVAREISETNGTAIPVTNLVGTFAVPQAIPLDPGGLMGYSETVQTDADEVYGEFTLGPSTDGSPVTLTTLDIQLQCRYSPIVEMTEREWSELIQYMTPHLVGNAAVFGAPG